jgi:hypothetical protein
VAARRPDLATPPLRLETLLEVSRQLSRIQPLESLLGNINEACGHLLDSDSVGIRMVEGDDLVVVGASGAAREEMPTPRIKIGDSLIGAGGAAGRPLEVRVRRTIPARRGPAPSLGLTGRPGGRGPHRGTAEGSGLAVLS